MPSPTLKEVRKRFPQLDNLSDNELTVRIGNTYPKLLEKDKDLANEFTDLTEFTLGGAASQVGQKISMGAPMMLGKIGWGVAEGFTAPIIGDYSASDLPVFGLVKSVTDALGYKVDVTGAINRYAKEMGDEADNQLRKINEGGRVQTLVGEMDIEGTESEMPTEWERRLGNIAQTSATLLPTIAAAPAGTPAVLAAAGLTTFGSTFPEARRSYEEAGDENANQKAFAIAAVDGIKTSIITAAGMKVAQKLGGGDLDKIAGLRGDAATAQSLGQVLKGIGIGMPIEGVEEALDEAISAGIATVTYNPNADVYEAAAEAFFAGALISGAVGSVSGYSRYREAKKQADSLEEAGLPETARRVLEKAEEEIKAADAEPELKIEETKDAKPDKIVGRDEEGRPTREVQPAEELDFEDVPEIEETAELTQQIEAAEAEAATTAEVSSLDELEGIARAKGIEGIDWKRVIGLSRAQIAEGVSTRDIISVLYNTLDIGQGTALLFTPKSGKNAGVSILNELTEALDAEIIARRTPTADVADTADLAAETSAEPAATQSEDLFGGDVTSDELYELIDNEAYNQLGVEPITPLEQSVVDDRMSRLSKEQKEEYDEEVAETVKLLAPDFNTQAKKDKWTNEDLQRRRATDAGLKEENQQIEAQQAPQEDATQPTTEEVVVQKEELTEEQRESLLQKLTKLAQPSNRMRKSGKFLWKAGRGDNRDETTQYPNKPKSESGLKEFQDELNGLVTNDLTKMELLAELKQTVLERAQTKESTGKGKQLNTARTKAEIEFLKAPEGQEDILDNFINTVGGKIDVPVGKDKKVIVKGDSKEKLPAEYDGIDNFATAVNELSRSEPSVAGSLVNRVPASKIDNKVDEYAQAVGVETDQFWDLMADAINRRIERNRARQAKKDEVPLTKAVTTKSEESTTVKAGELTEQSYFVANGKTYIVAQVFDDGEGNVSIVVQTVGGSNREYEDIDVQFDTPLYLEKFEAAEGTTQEMREEVVTPAEDESDPDVPFASAPAEIVNGVRMPKASSDLEETFLARVAALIPRIQRRLGGAKVRNIFISRQKNMPAFSNARGGDFGSIFLNPELITAMEEAGKGDLESILIEEIIHNYNGLALFHSWNQSGRQEPFEKYYERMMTEVFLEMSKGEIADTVFYYGEQIKGDAVAIAEEYIRIALQRKLTGTINEDFFGRKVERGGALSQLMDILARFWNGVTRGFTGRSPRIRTLKKRMRRMMKDNRVSFPALDGAKLVFTPASQGEFEFEQPVTPELSTREYETILHNEDGFNFNTGDFMAALFGMSQLELAQIDKQTKMAGKGANTIPAMDAAFIQRQRNTDIPLPDEFIVKVYTKLHEKVGNDTRLNDTQKDQAIMYALSRISNDARRFIIRKKRFTDSSEALLGGRDYNLSQKMSQRLADYYKFSKRLGEKVVKSGEGLVSLDVPLELTEESEGGTLYDMVPNPFIMSADLELVNDELLRYIEEAQLAFTPAERDLFSFAFERDFKYGYLAEYSRQRGLTGGGQASNLWRSVKEKLALTLAAKKDLDLQIEKRVPEKLLPRIEKVQRAFEVLSEQTKADMQKAEEARVQKNIRELTAEEVQEKTEDKPPIQSVEVTPEGEVLSAAFDITNNRVRRMMNLPELQRDEEGRIINQPRERSILEEAEANRKRKTTAASLPPEFVSDVAERADELKAEDAKNYRASEEVKADESVKSTDSRSEEVKQRMKDAAENTTSWWKSIKETVADLTDLGKQLTRQFRFLNPRTHGHTVEVLRQFQATTETSQARAREALRSITDGLTGDQFEFFTRVLVYRDLKQSVQSGLYQKNKDLPFGIKSKAELDFLLQEAEADLAAPENQKVRDAIQRRKAILTDLTKKMQQRKLLPDTITDAENYFHRITLEYRDAAQRGVLSESTDVRTRRAGFQKKRKGSEKDYTTDFLESENAVLSQGYAQVQTHDTLVRLKGLLDQKSQLKAQAKASNEAALIEDVGDVDAFFAPFNKNIAIGISQIQKLISRGQIFVPSKFTAAAESLVGGATKHPDTFAFFKHLMDTNSAGAGYAGMIFKAIRAKEQATKNQLGNNYKTWRDLVGENKELTIWQPEKGNFLYKGTVASDAALIKWFDQAGELDTTTISKNDLRKQLVLGGRKDEWAIPVEVAKQLDELKPEEASGPVAETVSKISGGGVAQWKYWKLFNPLGFIKYELNNLTGDFDAAFAYSPEIVSKYSKQAYQDLYDYHVNNKPLPADMEELLQKGVLGSGYMLQDLAEMKPELAVDALFGDFADGLKKKSTWLKNFTNNYKRKVATINQVREDTLRLAAYRYFQEKLETGADVFGASDPKELALIPDKKDRAAKMARELLGDYGAISTGGRWLRRHMLPFWSWMEINAPRYVRMMKNARLEERDGTAARVAGAVGKKAVMQTGKFALLASTMPFFVNLFNRFMIAAGFVDEEDKRVIDARNQQHLLLYSTDEGRVISLRMQGALTDALEWFGAGSIYATATDVAFTDDTVADAAGQYLSQGEWWKGGLNRVGTSLTPLLKVPAEAAFKKTLFPDVTRPAPMRDTTAYVLQNLEMGWAMMGVNSLYKLAQDFPTSGVTGGGSPARSLWQFVGYTTDTGESAYNYIKSKEYRFYEEKEGEQSGFTTNSKQDALYYHKKALKWGDTASAERWKQEYLELGGTASGIKRSVSAAKPLAKVKKYRKEFINNLSDTEKEILQRAEEWYKGIK